MTTLSLKIDTYQLAQRLQKKGFTEQQAEGIIDITKEVDLDSIVTRDYLDVRLKDLEQRLTIKLGGMIVALGGLLVAIKYFG